MLYALATGKVLVCLDCGFRSGSFQQPSCDCWGKVVRRLRLLNSLFSRRDKRHPTSRTNELSARPYRVDGIQ